jgi:hypothetical protein
MAYTETTRTSYGKKLGSSFKGIFTGIILFIIGTIALFWNEGNFVKTKKALNEGQSQVLEMPNIDKINPEFNGKFVHTSGLANTQDTLIDDFLGIKEVAIALIRKVEYYQWVEKTHTETKNKVGGGEEKKTTYTYQQEWTNQPIDSKSFKDPQYQSKNFVRIQVSNKKEMAKNVSFGAYVLPEFIISAMGGDKPIHLDLGPMDIKNIESKILNRDAQNPQNGSNSANIIHSSQNQTFIGSSASNPQVGDVRITYTKVEPAQISILAKVNGNSFESYQINNKTVSQVAQGNVSAENMFQSSHSSNSLMTWIIRGIGLLVIIIGLRGILGFVETIFRFFPFLASIVGTGIGTLTTAVGFCWSLLIISISWMFYRPIIAILFILIIFGILFFLKKKSTKKILSTAQA